ncbi:MAG: class II fructose-bisphosphate aldolase [Spirochaetales bacterium]|nr:class II fructose-bisphosphate aldolase [Spirochaetales bacterium]
MLVNMTKYVKTASQSDTIVPAFNVFGYEDAFAVIRAAEKFHAPAILMSNSDSVEHMDLKHSAALYRSLGEATDIPVSIHLDHAKTFELILRGVEAGYTSVMYDGSALSLEENIENTQEVIELAEKHNISVEAELGSVPYIDRNEEVKSILTSPEEAGIFTRKARVNGLAVAVGSLHRMQTRRAKLDFNRIVEIEHNTDVPLVIHGFSGIIAGDIKRLCSTTVGKVNIGTELRLTFGNSLKSEIELNPDEFDRVKLFKKPMKAVQDAVEEKYRLLGWEEKE